MINKPLISVVLPVHNGQAYLAEAIDSILAQTHRRLELIAVDDGSSDASADILTDYARRDSRVQVITLAHRQGQGHAVNVGTDAAQGEWIAQMDADDLAYPQRLAVQWRAMVEQGLDVCGSWAQCFGESQRLIRFAQGQEAIRYELLFTCPLLQPAVMFRGRVARSHAYAEQSFLLEHELWTRLIHNNKLGNLPQVLHQYRIHAGQWTRHRAATSAYQYGLALRHFRALFPHAPAADQTLFQAIRKRSPAVLTAEGLAAAGDFFRRYFQTDDEEARERLAKRWSKLCLVAAEPGKPDQGQRAGGDDRGNQGRNALALNMLQHPQEDPFMTLPLISVVMPVHNGQAYLSEAIDSILAQTHRRLELIAVDDGSSDASADILTDYGRRDSRIRVITLARQQRQGHAANVGVRAAQGEWIARMDADDIAHPQRLAVQWRAMAEQGLDVCGTWAQCFGESQRLIRVAQGQEAICYELLFTCPLLEGSALFRGKVARAHPFEERSFMFDHELWTRLIHTHRLGNLPQILLQYRIHAGQWTQCLRTARQVYQQGLGLRHFRALFPQAPKADQTLFQAIRTHSPAVLTAAGLASAGDFFRRYLQPDDEEARVLLANRWSKLCLAAAKQGTPDCKYSTTLA